MTDTTERHVVARDGTRIAWQSRGPRAEAAPDRATFVLTNGLSTTAEFWDPLATDLARDHRVVDWSYRGHGASEPSRSGDYAIAAHVDDLARVTEAAGGARAPVHVAFSMGVTVLLELYRARPDLVGAMVLVAGGADHPFASSAIFRAPLVGAAVRAATKATASLAPALSPVMRVATRSRALFPVAQAVGALGRDAPRAEVERFFRSVGEMDARAYFGTLASLMDAHASDVLPRIGVPVLVVAPERDVMALRGDLEALRRAIPRAEWLELPGTSHAILLEAGPAIAARVRDFVGAHALRRAADLPL